MFKKKKMKNQYHIPLLIILLFLSFTSFSQQSGDFVKAMKAFDNSEFGKAETIFKRAYSRSDDRTEKNKISFKLAQCYYFLGDYKKAETNFNAVFFLVNLDPIAIILASLCCLDNLVDFKL